MDIDNIYEKLKETLDSSDCFVIIEITKNCDGWLDTNIWALKQQYTFLTIKKSFANSNFATAPFL